MLVVGLWLWLLSLVFSPPARRPRGRRFVPSTLSALRARKPAWVIEEVMRLKALMPHMGCRKIAATFDRLHAARHHMTVSKSYVAELVCARQLEIQEIRTKWKRRVPHPIPVNDIWGLDLTGKTDLRGIVHPILGLVDHGSRFNLGLRALVDKSTITVLRALLDAIERYGKPGAIRTDNDGAFTSRLFRCALWFLGIRHQLTEAHCPWQNGRIERFFGTLKEKLNYWAVDSLEQLDLALGDFRLWYNHVRPHHHLHGSTPGEAWRGIDPYATAPRHVTYFSAWDGMLTGLHMRR